MEHTTDSQLVKTMGLVLGVLVSFFFLIVLAINLGVEPKNTGPNAIKLAVMAERVTPVGSVRTRLNGTEVVTAAAQASSEPKTGRQLAESLCLACHSTATAAALGAPALGDAIAWQSRLTAGMDALVNSAISGKGAMPPRGGSSLSDEEIRLAVEYLTGQ